MGDTVSHTPSARLRVLVPLAVALAVGLVATGCGGSSNDQSQTTQAKGVQQNQVVQPTEKPTPGGKITYGLEADSDGFNPTSNRWAISGTMVGLAVYDTLVAYDAKGQTQPYLAKSLTASADYKTWTIALRPNITFSNGAPLTADAVTQVLNGHLASALTGPAFSSIDKVTTTDTLTTTVTMKEPWVSFPSTLTNQLGVVPEPSTLSGKGDVPIGTGPFVQVEWQQKNFWKGKKNPTYWRKDGDGVQLPYLDELEFRPITQQETRTAGFESGDLQMMHTTDPKAIVHFRQAAKDGTAQIVEDNGEGEEGFIIMNNAKPPFDDVNMRRALAYATDAAGYNNTLDDGVPEVADNVFKTSSAWYAPTKNYPAFDMAKATQLVNDYKSANGGKAPAFVFGVTQDNAPNGAYLQQLWQQAGFQVDVKTYDQTNFIVDAIQGKYQANLWRQFGAPDPDGDYLWWTSKNAGDAGEGGLTLNIARHKSTCVDTALTTGRESADLSVRKKAYADLQQCFADEVPYIWLNHAIWAVVAAPKVRGITNGPLPDGQESLPIGGAGDFGGVTRLTQTWLAK